MTLVAQARDRDRLHPVYLVEIVLLNSGPTLYLSDRNITVGGQDYEDYMDGLSGLGSELERLDSSGLNSALKLTFKNDAYKSYDHLVEIGGAYPFERAEVTIKECYLDSTAVPSDTDTVFKGVLDEPRKIDLMRFTCMVTSMEFKADHGV